MCNCRVSSENCIVITFLDDKVSGVFAREMVVYGFADEDIDCIGVSVFGGVSQVVFGNVFAVVFVLLLDAVLVLYLFFRWLRPPGCC